MVYSIGSTPAARVDVKNPLRLDLMVGATVEHPGWNEVLSPSPVFGSSVAHAFRPISEIGGHDLTEEVTHNGWTMDSENVRFYSVFPRENDVAEWYYTADITFHDGFFATTSLHPFSREILEFVLSKTYISKSYNMKERTNPLPGRRTRISAAEALTELIGDYITYDSSHSDHWDDFTILNLNGRNPAGIPAGDCSDFAAAYASCARSIGLPVRYILIPYLHAFNEVYIDGEWVHVEPQGTFNNPDIYLRQGWAGNFCVESSPANINLFTSDRMTTLKYMVGIISSTVNITVNENGAGEAQFTIVNRAPFVSMDPLYYAVQNFEVEVVDTGGIPRIEVQNLPGRLIPTESHGATLRVWGAVPSHDYTIRLKLRYQTVDGSPCEKTTTLTVST
jgi:hypothetical protein